MAFGVGFRVAPNVRLRATRRGPRVSLGPRIARVHLGGGTPAVSAGQGPVTVWQTLSGGGHAPPPRGRASHRKTAEWNSVRDHLDQLLGQHHREVTHAQRPVVPAPARTRRRDVRRDLRRRAAAGTPWWRLDARRRAWREADARLDTEVAARTARRVEQHREEQAAADAWWAALLANDPDTVMARLDAAFAEHELPGAATAVVGATAHVAVSVLPLERLIGPRERTISDTGNPSLARVTKTRRHELYQGAIGSAVIAVAAEALATCPGLEAVDVAVLCPEQLGGPAVLLLAELPRASVLPHGATRPVTSTLSELADRGHATVVQDRGRRVGALRPLDDEDPDVRALLDALDAE